MKRIYRVFLILGISTTIGVATYACTIQTHPRDSQSFYQQGKKKLQKRDYQGAIKDFNQALAVNHNYAEAHVNRGIVYDELGNIRQAIKDYNQAISLNPNLAEAYYNRGNAYNQLGDFKQAIKDYDQAISINPKYTYAYANRSTTYYSLGKKQEAIEDLQKAVKLFEEKGDQLNKQRVLKQMEKFQRP